MPRYHEVTETDNTWYLFQVVRPNAQSIEPWSLNGRLNAVSAFCPTFKNKFRIKTYIYLPTLAAMRNSDSGIEVENNVSVMELAKKKTM